MSALIRLGRAITDRLPESLSHYIRSQYRMHLLRRSMRAEALNDPEVLRAWRLEAAPPPELRVRVHGQADLHSYLLIGKENYDTLLRGLQLAQQTVDETSRVLDFGCGPGRTLIWWAEREPRPILYGADIDREATDWAKAYLPAEIHHNEPLPPLPFPDKHFDVIYSVSVFTHLDAAYQDAWLAELRRVLRDDGVALFTVRSQHDIESRPPALQEQIRRDGIVFEYDWLTARFFPDFYQATYHSADYIARHWGGFFRIVGKVTAGYVDVIVMRRS